MSDGRIVDEEARKILAAANDGEEVIKRRSDGAVFIRLDVAEGVVSRLIAQNRNRGRAHD